MFRIMSRSFLPLHVGISITLVEVPSEHMWLISVFLCEFQSGLLILNAGEWIVSCLLYFCFQSLLQTVECDTFTFTTCTVVDGDVIDCCVWIFQQMLLFCCSFVSYSSFDLKHEFLQLKKNWPCNLNTFGGDYMRGQHGTIYSYLCVWEAFWSLT